MKSPRNTFFALFILAAFTANAQTRYLDEVFSSVTKTSDVVYGWNWSVLPTAEDTVGITPV
ncbi:MAG TPA: hypothetical protein VNJ07_09420, partial [Chitinophagales bacterium]|nr:hypothetical protein [Chitinophagales bacterium]